MVAEESPTDRWVGNVPSQQEFNLLTPLATILRRLKFMSDHLSADTFPSISMLVSCMFTLVNVPRSFSPTGSLFEHPDDDKYEGLPAMKVALRSGIMNDFPAKQEYYYMLGGFLNPFFKDYMLESEPYDENRGGPLKRMINRLMEENPVPAPVRDPNEPSTSKTPRALTSRSNPASQDLFESQGMLEEFTQYADEYYGTLEVDEGGENELKKEILMYMDPKQTSRPKSATASPSWWKANAAKMPLLARVARKYLAVQASSTPSERMFSASGTILAPRRMNLAPSHLKKFVFCQNNGPFLLLNVKEWELCRGDNPEDADAPLIEGDSEDEDEMILSNDPEVAEGN